MNDNDHLWIDGPVDASPEAMDYDGSRLARLEEIFAGLVTTGKVQAASYCVARRGKVIADRSLGRRHFESVFPFLPGTWRRVASATKVITSLGVLKLVEDGRLLMETSIGSVLPEFDTPRHRGIRIWHLLTHSSGLPADPGSNAEPNPDHEGFWKNLDTPDWIPYLAAQPLAHEPGVRWCYGSVGFALLGEIVARTSGMPYADYVAKHILAPAGMRDTFFHPGERPHEGFSIVSPWEQGLFEKRTALEGASHPFLALGGAFSTCSDMVRLGRLFVEGGRIDGKRVVGRPTVDAMCRVQLTVPAPHWGDHFPDWSYGLGIEPARHPLTQTGSVWGHEGAGRCALWWDPREELVAYWTLPTTIDWDPDFCWTPRAVLLSGLR